MKYLKLAFAAVLISGTGLSLNANAQAPKQASSTVNLKSEVNSAVKEYAAVIKKADATTIQNTYKKVKDLFNHTMSEAKADVVGKNDDGPEMKKYEALGSHFNEMVAADRETDKTKVLAAMNAFVAKM